VTGVAGLPDLHLLASLETVRGCCVGPEGIWFRACGRFASRLAGWLQECPCRVQRATGQGTLALVQSVRLQHARQLLQRSRMSVEQVAAAVGYPDATALRRLLRKSAGLTPSRLRA